MTAVPLSIFPSTDAVFRILDDEAVILDLASAAYFGLNSLGARFWQLVSQNSSYQAAVDVLLGEYAVDEVTLNQDLAALGPDSGFDTMGELPLAAGLSVLLDALDREGQLPKTVLFCGNPVHNALFATLIGSFQDGSCPGKIQFGPAWWWNDHKDGNLAQLRSLASHGVLGTFVGMVTDSRSFASYPRHEYFRRLLCRQLGDYVEAGEYPNDAVLLKELVERICYRNAKSYFDF